MPRRCVLTRTALLPCCDVFVFVCACKLGAGGAGGGKAVLDGRGAYELVGIVSHMGANTGCGHYVAHVKKNGR